MYFEFAHVNVHADTDISKRQTCKWIFRPQQQPQPLNCNRTHISNIGVVITELYNLLDSNVKPYELVKDKKDSNVIMFVGLQVRYLVPYFQRNHSIPCLSIIVPFACVILTLTTLLELITVIIYLFSRVREKQRQPPSMLTTTKNGAGKWLWYVLTRFELAPLIRYLAVAVRTCMCSGVVERGYFSK